MSLQRAASAKNNVVRLGGLDGLGGLAYRVGKENRYPEELRNLAKQANLSPVNYLTSKEAESTPELLGELNTFFTTETASLTKENATKSLEDKRTNVAAQLAALQKNPKKDNAAQITAIANKLEFLNPHVATGHAYIAASNAIKAKFSKDAYRKWDNASEAMIAQLQLAFIETGAYNPTTKSAPVVYGENLQTAANLIANALHAGDDKTIAAFVDHILAPMIVSSLAGSKTRNTANFLEPSAVYLLPYIAKALSEKQGNEEKTLIELLPTLNNYVFSTELQAVVGDDVTGIKNVGNLNSLRMSITSIILKQLGQETDKGKIAKTMIEEAGLNYKAFQQACAAGLPVDQRHAAAVYIAEKKGLKYASPYLRGLGGTAPTATIYKDNGKGEELKIKEMFKLTKNAKGEFVVSAELLAMVNNETSKNINQKNQLNVVQLPDGTIAAFPKYFFNEDDINNDDNLLSHSHLGAKAKAAGEVIVNKDGVVIYSTPISGHYNSNNTDAEQQIQSALPGITFIPKDVAEVKEMRQVHPVITDIEDMAAFEATLSAAQQKVAAKAAAKKA